MIENSQHLEALKKLKQHLDYILANIFNNISSKEEDIARNIWIIEIIDEGLKMLKQKPQPSLLNSQK